jgi:hypothetical protein
MTAALHDDIKPATNEAKLHAAAHMAELRHTRHDAAIQWRKQWRALVGLGFGWHQDAKAARQQMRDCIAAARFYRKCQKHYAAIAKATGAAQ